MGEVFPCMTRSARTMSPPNAAPIAWWPRQTPRMGVTPVKRRITGTEMPAILAEVSFVSSPTDESELQRSAYRQQIAEALYQGLARYAETSRKVKLASASK